jgi:(p)ppGpp synthase/HD superfamily hydrolase
MNLATLKTNIEGFISEHKSETVDFSDLLGKHIYKLYQVDDRYIVIFTNKGYIYVLLHFQDCCEDVYIEDICGDLENSKGLVVRAEENSNSVEKPTRDDSETWTYYKLDTVKDNVTIRFVGSSNGYYSEDVTVRRVYIPELLIQDKVLNF